MWQELALLHRPCGKAVSPLDGPGASWTTCLRQVLFLPPGGSAWSRGPGQPQDTLHIGFSAHLFLAEICSGLHSPLFGETEVFGQFRAFRESHAWHPAWGALFDAVDEDVKKIRRAHLTGLGPQSYGSLARRRLPEGGRVAIAGSGRLARDLLPWLDMQELFLLARDPAKAARECPGTHQVLPLAQALAGDSRLRGAHWLIAAPLANEELASAWERMGGAGIVLDFRGESRFAALPRGTSAYFDLHSLYGELEGVKRRQENKKREALAFAAELSARREAAVWHRPFGWEDAFA